MSNPSDLIKPCDEITVKVLRVDDEKQKIALGLKQLAEDPWSAAVETFKVGEVYPGRVSRVADFGVFVSLASGLTGLVPSAETGLAYGADLARAFPAGSDITVMVLEVDAAVGRIRLSVKAIQEAKEAAELREYHERTQPSQSEGFGTLADKLRGALESRDK